MLIDTIVNLTPHAITIRNSVGDVTIPPSGQVARVTSTPGVAREVDGVPCPIYTPPTWGEVEGLPEPQEGVIYIVSALVGGRTFRADVVCPGTGPNDGAIREDGKIVAVTRLVQLS